MNVKMPACNVCRAEFGQPIYVSSQPISITSLCEVIPETTTVYFCQNCGHLRTKEIVELEAYYSDQYKIMIESEEEDQLYAVVNGRKVFRTEHQVNALLEKIDLPHGARVLDYGCAKGALIKQLKTLRPDIVPHLFDVSEMYLPFWRKFTTPDHWAVYEPRSEWRESFDLVISFYALEHVADPRAALTNIAGMLKPGGYFYCVVPNTYANVADFVVVDHVNHFSASSWQHLLTTTGLSVLEIDDSSHQSAFVVRAQRLSTPSPADDASIVKSAGSLAERVREMGVYWQEFAEHVQEFERTKAARSRAAIYGSGFYGTFIATCLKDLSMLDCFIDQNPYRQSQTHLGKSIFDPLDLPDEIGIIYVGLNPAQARACIESIAEWRGKNHIYFWL